MTASPFRSIQILSFSAFQFQLHHCHQGRNRRQVFKPFWNLITMLVKLRHLGIIVIILPFLSQTKNPSLNQASSILDFFIEWREIVSSETSAVRISQSAATHSPIHLVGIVDFGRLTQLWIVFPDTFWSKISQSFLCCKWLYHLIDQRD